MSRLPWWRDPAFWWGVRTGCGVMGLLLPLPYAAFCLWLAASRHVAVLLAVAVWAVVCWLVVVRAWHRMGWRP